jgi:membrane protease YdiL (CAAX protease family)
MSTKSPTAYRIQRQGIVNPTSQDVTKMTLEQLTGEIDRIIALEDDVSSLTVKHMQACHSKNQGCINLLMHDAGRALATVFSTLDADILLKVKYQWLHGANSPAYQAFEKQHHKLRAAQQQINQRNHEISLAKKAVYSRLMDIQYIQPHTTINEKRGYQNHIENAGWNLYAICLMPFLGVLGSQHIWRAIPFLAPIIFQVSGIPMYYIIGLLAISIGIPSVFALGALFQSMIYTNLYWNLFLLKAIRHVNAIFLDISGALDWVKMKYAFAPDQFDWKKACAGFLYQFIMMVISFGPLLMTHGAPNFSAAWLLSTLICIAFIGVQTITEELMFRRPAAEDEQDTLAKICNLVFMPVLFAFAHFWNPELSVYNGNLFAKIATLSNYATMGYVWAWMTYLSGGIEFSWGMHFANNLFLSVIIGFYPSVVLSIPLLVLPAPWSSLNTAPFAHINSLWQVACVWFNMIIQAVRSTILPYSILLPQRALYAPLPAQEYVTTKDLNAAHARISYQSSLSEARLGRYSCYVSESLPDGTLRAYIQTGLSKIIQNLCA